MAIRPGGHGDVTQENVVWKVTNKVPMIPSLVLVGRRLFGVHDTTGTVFCLDAMTGSDILAREDRRPIFCLTARRARPNLPL